MADEYSPPPLRASVACVACNKKKVRCVFEVSSQKCRSCIRHQWSCFQRQQKRRGRRAGNSRRDGSARQDTMIGNVRSSGESGTSEVTSKALSPSDSSSSWTANPRISPRVRENDTVSNTTSRGSNPYTSIIVTCGFMERDDYIRPTDSGTNDEGVVLPTPATEGPSENDLQILRLQRAFDIPPRAVRESLIDAFMRRCAPWMPIVERNWLQESDGNEPSILLLQSVFLAASRVTSATAVTAYASSHEFYRRAKALFYSGWEKNPLTVIAAVCILHWYNPECPEHVSTNTSGFWRYVGVGLAHQIGLHKEPPNAEGSALRRRIWWSLFARDCLISAGQGRPLAVNLYDSELKPPCVDDFRGSSMRPDLFIAYVEICSVLGHLTQFCRRDSLTRRTRQSFTRSLQGWVHGLPESLRLFQTGEGKASTRALSRYDFEARQLHVPYFISLIILCRTPSANQPPSATTIMASAHVIAIFEDFLARDEIQYLGSIFTFYLLAAGIGLLSSMRTPNLWSKAEPTMHTIYTSLEELAKRWPSALAPLKVLRTIAAKQQQSNGINIAVTTTPKIPDDHLPFFNGFGPGLTWAWGELIAFAPSNRRAQTEVDMLGISSRLQVLSPPLPQNGDESAMATGGLQMHTMLLDSATNFEDTTIQQGMPDEGLLNLQYEGIGDWLLNDYDVLGDLFL
ncbi:fungal-specific transcription factor domain-containing protein [Aspergillus spectabilis]